MLNAVWSDVSVSRLNAYRNIQALAENVTSITSEVLSQKLFLINIDRYGVRVAGRHDKRKIALHSLEEEKLVYFAEFTEELGRKDGYEVMLNEDGRTVEITLYGDPSISLEEILAHLAVARDPQSLQNITSISLNVEKWTPDPTHATSIEELRLPFPATEGFKGENLEHFRRVIPKVFIDAQQNEEDERVQELTTYIEGCGITDEGIITQLISKLGMFLSINLPEDKRKRRPTWDDLGNETTPYDDYDQVVIERYFRILYTLKAPIAAELIHWAVGNEQNFDIEDLFQTGTRGLTIKIPEDPV